MVESHAFISADTISLDSRAAHKYRWYLYIYVLSVNLRVPGPLTACTIDTISKQRSMPLFVFLEAIRHIRHFLIDKVFKETLCIP